MAGAAIRRLSAAPGLRTFLRYCAVGAAGFACDAGFLALFLALGSGPYLGRLGSIALALCLTWWLNRRFTFAVRSAPGWREFLLYHALGLLGATLNYLIYSLLLAGGLPPFPALGVASAIALALNYLLARFVVFGRDA